MRNFRLFVAIFAAVVGCGASSDEADRDTGTVAFEAFTLDLGTLPDSYPVFSAERAAALPAEVAQSGADVLCLNGVYDERLRAELARVGAFPHRVDMQTDETTLPSDPADATGVVPPPPTAAACVGNDVALLSDALSCFSAKCAANGRLTSYSCIYNGGCAAQHNGLQQTSASCHACFHNCAELGDYTFDETKTRCTAPSTGVPLARRARHGTMLLSKHPLSAEQRFVLPATERQQVVLAATVTLPNAAAVDVYCLQTSSTPYRPSAEERYRGVYGGGDPFNGWFREYDLQIAKLMAFVRSRSQSRRAVVLGNVEASPYVEEEGTVITAGKNATGLRAFEGTFIEAVPADFRPSCTICGRTNRLLQAPLEEWTTHIFVSGIPAANIRSAHRTFMGDVVTTGDERRPRVPLSSSYGFRSRLVIDP